MMAAITEQHAMRNILTLLTQSLVDTADAVSVDETEVGQTLVYRISAAVGETGYLIGKEGKNAAALRQLMGSIGRKMHRRVVIEFSDDERAQDLTSDSRRV